MKPTPTSPPESAPLLAFGAHPDDIEFGCGGVIARETQAGRPAHFVICSRGEAATNGTPVQRTAEARKGAAALGASLEFADLGGDAHFEWRRVRALKLAAIIRRVRPVVILAPTPVENQHPDHAVLGKIVRDAARLARYGGIEELRRRPTHAIGQLLFYAVTVEGEPREQPPVFIDVSDAPVAKAWTAAMQAHVSQVQTRRYVELQLARATVNGERCGLRLAIPLFPSDPLVFGSLGMLERAARRF
ncbi:MAG: PIG-L family deacetylase [Verrucomicrobia bacterium]|nr:PIG-L family deacetylase [Verrucomicrobiota bacterium]